MRSDWRLPKLTDDANDHLSVFGLRALFQDLRRPVGCGLQSASQILGLDLFRMAEAGVQSPTPVLDDIHLVMGERLHMTPTYYPRLCPDGAKVIWS